MPRSDLVVGKWIAAVVFSLAALLTLLFSFLVLRWDGLDGAAVPKHASKNGAYTP